MGNTAFLCSGQGSQYPGMGKELFDSVAAVRDIYTCGSDILGFDLAKISFEGDETTLARTAVSQPAIFAVSLAAHTVVREFCTPDAYAGHSLGEYAALTAAGAYSMEDGFRLIGARAAAMQAAAEHNPGAMFAIVGSDEATVTKVCEQTDGYVLPVNFNSPAQTVIAGETAPVQAAADTLAAIEGVKAVKLAVSSGFHSRLMDEAAAALAETLKAIPAKPLHTPFYCNLTGQKLAAHADLTDYLTRHLVSGVRFHAEIAAMLADGIDSFVELGPGKVLTMLVKRTFKEASAFNVENLKTLEKFKAAL